MIVCFSFAFQWSTIEWTIKPSMVFSVTYIVCEGPKFRSLGVWKCHVH